MVGLALVLAISPVTPKILTNLFVKIKM